MSDVDAAALIRTKYRDTRWSVPLADTAVAATLSGNDASHELPSTDGPYGPGLYIFTDAAQSQAMTSQHEWSRQHFLVTEGGYVFWSALRQNLAVTIDAGTPEEVRLSGTAIVAAFRTYMALEAEANLHTMRYDTQGADAVMPEVFDYSGYLIGHVPSGGSTAVSMAPDPNGRELLAAFTSYEAFLAYVAATGQHDMQPRQCKGGEFWALVTQIPADGLVFNCMGPAKPVAFVSKIAQVVLDSQRRSA